MLYEWPNQVLPALPMIYPSAMEMLGTTSGLFAPSSNPYPLANRAYYLPFHLDQPIIVTKLWWINGTTASGNVDIGIYDSAFTRIVSAGSTPQVGTSVIQSVDITDTLIGPGDFYIAISMDNITGTIFALSSSGGIPRGQAMGTLIQASAFPLPANGNPVAAVSAIVIWIGLRQGGTVI